jgi:hypothetical protein
MSVAQTNLDGASGSPPPLPVAAAASRRWRFRWAWLLAAGVIALAVLGVLLGKAAVYQPIGWGGVEGRFPGMAPGVGIQAVNNFALLGEDYYVPPQRGVFSFGASIVNNGSQPVTIEAVTPYPSRGSGWYPIWLAGPVRYTTDMGRPGTPRAYILHNLRLGPGQGIFIGIPLRTRPCGQTDVWMTIPAFYVKERFLFFTHTVAIPWSMTGAKLIMREPGGAPGQPHTICAPK